MKAEAMDGLIHEPPKLKVMQVWRLGLKFTQGQGPTDEVETLIIAPNGLRSTQVREMFLKQWVDSGQWEKDGSVCLGNTTIAVSTCYVLDEEAL